MPRRAPAARMRPGLDQVQRERIWKRRVDKEDEMVAPYSSYNSCPFAVNMTDFYGRPTTGASTRLSESSLRNLDMSCSSRPGTSCSSSSRSSFSSFGGSSQSINSATMARLDRLESILEQERSKREKAEQELSDLRKTINQRLR